LLVAGFWCVHRLNQCGLLGAFWCAATAIVRTRLTRFTFGFFRTTFPLWRSGLFAGFALFTVTHFLAQGLTLWTRLMVSPFAAFAVTSTALSTGFAWLARFTGLTTFVAVSAFGALAVAAPFVALAALWAVFAIATATVFATRGARTTLTALTAAFTARSGRSHRGSRCCWGGLGGGGKQLAKPANQAG